MAKASPDVRARGGSLVEELSQGALGDQRLNVRRDRVVATLERQPDRGFPHACADDAEVEALYRFLRNPRVSPDAILAPHLAATAARCAAVGTVLVLHDTTDMVFAGEAARRGLSRLGPARQGFWVHAALAVSADGARVPLGVVALQSYARPPRPPDAPRPTDRQRFASPTKESRRWLAGVTAVRARCGPVTQPVHIMDREADNYELYAGLIAQQERFIVRGTYDRCVVTPAGDATHLRAALADAPVVCEREVHLASRRTAQRPLETRQRHPPRAGRAARLAVSAHRLHVRRGQNVARSQPAQLAVHVVWVRELEAPADVEPVDWQLVTTEPIDTAEQILAIVDAYRARWLIEEYFKALKTGCAYEQRQLESLQTLRVALALLAPIAWRLLLLRHLARDQPATPALVALTPRQLHLLRAVPHGQSLAPAPSIAEALAVIARLGGHLRHNGPPGWLVLARGFQTLCDMELGWIAAAETRAHL